MDVFDTLIEELKALLPDGGGSFEPGEPAAEGRKNELILGRDAAFELGGGTLPSVAASLITESEELAAEDRIILCGPDIDRITGDCPFARIAVIRTDDIAKNGEQEAYSVIQNIDLNKFDLWPEGYMVRAGALTNREQARVSKKAVKDGLSFRSLGSLYIKKYRQDPHVKAVTMIFITDPAADYAGLDRIATEALTRFRALNHALSDLNMDCGHCEWKPVCDEFPEMKKLHKKAIRKK